METERAGTMKNWNSEGHLTDLAQELWASGEAEDQDIQRIDSHLRGCPACRAHQAEWRELFHALASLPVLEPSPSFDRLVMERVRKPAAESAAASWLPALVRRLRPVAVVTTALWTGVVIGGAVWLEASLGVSLPTLIARSLAFARELAWSAVIKIGALAHVSGLLEVWGEMVRTVPGPGVLSAVALMTALAGLAIWGLYRVTGYQPSRVNAHV